MSAERPKLRGLSEIYRYLRQNETPIYVITPTPFSLLGLDQWVGSLEFVNYFDIPTMIADIGKRPFITVGMTTWTILFLLGITSNRFAIRKLGRRWQSLHRLVYAAGILAVIHFWWLVKADITLPRRWAIAIGALLLFRVWWAYRGRLSLRS